MKDFIKEEILFEKQRYKNCKNPNCQRNYIK